MNIIEAKEKLQKDGYTWFELEEFDKKFYDWISPLKCNERTNLKESFSLLRADSLGTYLNEETGEYEKIRINAGDFKSFKEANDEKNKLIEKNVKFQQIWHFADVNTVFDEYDLNESNYYRFIKKLVSYFYDYSEEQHFSNLINFTYYDKNCELQNHSDGTGTGRICALLIYLNEDYNEEDGGLLILNNEETIVPSFGRVAIIDLKTFDIPHMVTKVTGGIGRYAILTFVKRKEDEFVDNAYNPNIK